MTTTKADRAVALVSGGLDSVVSLARAREESEIRLVLFVDYAQRAVERERYAVLGVVDYYGVPFRDVDAGWLGSIAPKGMQRATAAGESTSPALDSLDAVWIPNRNGVLLAVAAAFAESYGCNHVVTGFNREEAVEFADNSAEYIRRANASLELSTRNTVKVVSYTQDLDKTEILELGARLNAPLSLIWSCYHSSEHMCGACGSCKRLKAALAAVEPDARPPIEFAT